MLISLYVFSLERACHSLCTRSKEQPGAIKARWSFASDSAKDARKFETAVKRGAVARHVSFLVKSVENG